jgi:hypothetical protein
MTRRSSILKQNPPCAELYELLSSRTADKEVAWKATLKIHSSVMQYKGTVRNIRIRKRNGKTEITSVQAKMGAVGALERLRTAKGNYARGKAYHELPAPAHTALRMAAERAGRLRDASEWRIHPDFLFVPDGDIVASLVPKAIELASRKDPEIKKSSMFTRTNPARDSVIEEIMRAYRHLHGCRKPPVKAFEQFLGAIATCYKELIPKGFGGGVRSNHT